MKNVRNDPIIHKLLVKNVAVPNEPRVPKSFLLQLFITVTNHWSKVGHDYSRKTKLFFYQKKRCCF